MLMKPEKKDAISVIMAKLKKPKMEEAPAEESEEGGAMEDDSVALETAAEELLSSIESKSAKGIVEALKSLIEMIDAEEDIEA